jgi:hypothetical protein
VGERKIKIIDKTKKQKIKCPHLGT